MAFIRLLLGLITAVLGGCPGMISGATGAIAVVVVALVAAMVLSTFFSAFVLIGLFKLGKFKRLVPHSVMFGFVNALAIVIFMAQFQTTAPGGGTQWVSGQPLLIMLGFVLLTMAIMQFLPKLTKAIPAGLAAIVTVSALIII